MIKAAEIDINSLKRLDLELQINAKKDRKDQSL